MGGFNNDQGASVKVPICPKCQNKLEKFPYKMVMHCHFDPREDDDVWYCVKCKHNDGFVEQ